MKMNRIICGALTAVLLAGGLTACMTEKEHQDKLAAQAKITKSEAQLIALNQVPNGMIKESELEREKGKLIWSFDIRTPGNKDTTEVNVDAITGKLVSVAQEKAEDGKKEKD